MTVLGFLLKFTLQHPAACRSAPNLQYCVSPLLHITARDVRGLSCRTTCFDQTIIRFHFKCNEVTALAPCKYFVTLRTLQSMSTLLHCEVNLRVFTKQTMVHIMLLRFQRTWVATSNTWGIYVPFISTSQADTASRLCTWQAFMPLLH